MTPQVTAWASLLCVKGRKGMKKQTREETGNENQMTALRFQTGGFYQTSSASLREAY